MAVGPAASGAVNRTSHHATGLPSISARIGLVVYALLIVYASWFPFTGWRTIGLSPWSWLNVAMPHYWTVFDLITNVIAYIPFGVLAVFAFYPVLTGSAAILSALLLGALLSTGMEAGQTFLPTRVASNLDLLTNSGGALLGAIIGHYTTSVFLEQSRLLSLRRLWFSHEASRGLIVLALWPLAQIYPQGYLFGHGQWLPVISSWLGELFSRPVDLNALLRWGHDLTAEHYWMAESIISACGLAGAVLAMMCLFRERAPKVALAGLLVATGLAAKSLASAVFFGQEHAFNWLTPGSQAGLLIGTMMLSGLAFAPPPAQRRVAGLALITALVVVNLAPVNPYFSATMQEWAQGKFLNLNGAAQVLSLTWPFFMLWFLYHPVHREK